MLGGVVRVERLVGVGGMAYVYEARRTGDGARVAVKCMLPALASDAVNVTRFLREADATSRVRSPNVVRIFETSSGAAEGVPPYFVMEYLEGEDLALALEVGGALPVAMAVDAVLQACAGVAEAHALGIVHRDLKPSNLIRCGRIIKVVDFGIAKSLEAGAGTLTETSDTFGSPSYMSPEQVRSTKRVDARSDVWSMGVVLYELLSGTVPFGGDTAGAVLAAIVADDPPSLRQPAPHVPPALEAIVLRCLVKDRERRVQSMHELVGLLRSFAAGDVPKGRSDAPRGVGRALALGLPLALATGVGGYFAVLRFASGPPHATVVAPSAEPSAPASTVRNVGPSDVTVPEVTLARPDGGPPGPSRRGAAPASASAPRFKPCTRNDECGPFEKCYPGGCSCKSGTMRCGEVCRPGGVTRDDCGCGQACAADEVCTDHSSAPRCEKCAPGRAPCGGNGCLDLRYESTDCGACGVACSAGTHCYGAKCVATVPLGGRCAGPADCAPNMHCSNGLCDCLPELHRCSGRCTVASCAGR